MAVFRCKMCGGDLEISEGVSIATCEYCGSKQTLPKIMDENLQGLYNRANTLRIKSEFDKAEKLYEKIIQSDDTQAEAYWGLILCKYGIEYVDDPATFKKIPTCHRASYESIIADEDYKAALENADISQREIYEEQAREIDRIQKDILALAQKEESYDVFICYKETDANGERTPDSVIANDIYYQLTQEGFKVFYAAITLEGKLGSAYEPIIFAALNSAKVMLAIGTKPEYFNAVWVKNEWSRFLKIIKKDRSKLLIPCYRDMDAYELPEEFAHLQAQNMAKIGFINDIVRGINKLMPKEEPKVTTVVKETVVASNGASAGTASFLKRAFMFLEDGDFESADEYCEKVLDIDPENARAYLGKLMIELKVRKQENLKDCKEPFDNSSNYKKAIRFGDNNFVADLKCYIEHIKVHNEEIKIKCEELIEELKICRKSAKINSKSKDEINRQIEIFENQIKVLTNLEKDFHRLDKELKDINKKNTLLINNISNLKAEKENCGAFAFKRKKEIDKEIYNLEMDINVLSQKAESLKQQVNGYISVGEINHDIDKKHQKILEQKNLLKILEKNIVRSDKEIISELIEYELGRTLLKDYEAYEKIINARVGDYIKFGMYEQRNGDSDSKDPIEWLVLEKNKERMLVISKYALDYEQYNVEETNVTWETCTLRNAWMNTFFNMAFSNTEKKVIPTVTVLPDKSSDDKANAGKATQDKIFLISSTEAEKYFDSSNTRTCKATDYAHSKSGFVSHPNDNCWWWLRSPGWEQSDVEYVIDDGDILTDGYVNSKAIAVRPAMWIDID